MLACMGRQEKQATAKRHGPAFWTQVVEEFERGSESQEQFTARRGMNIGTFRTWLYRLRKERGASTPPSPPVKKRRRSRAKAVRVLPVTVGSVSQLPDEAVEIALPSGTVVRFPPRVEPKYIGELLAVLTTRC